MDKYENLQNIPKNKLPKDRKGAYRNCFGSGNPRIKCISADYDSQELVILASLSKDPTFLDALNRGHDLHSRCAEVVFGQEWLDAAEDDCAYYETVDGVRQNKQCNCAKHKELRNAVKAISFGLAYGMSVKGLAARLDISQQEAQEVYDRYFAAFPAIGALLESFAAYGMAYGHIRTGGVTNFKRYFPYWRGETTPRGERGSIERASKNTPIQGLASQQVDVALVLYRDWIKDNNLWGSVWLVSQLHDEIFVQAIDTMAEEAKLKLEECMAEAGKITLGNNLLTATADITDRWYGDVA